MSKGTTTPKIGKKSSKNVQISYLGSNEGLTVDRHFTKEGVDPLENLEYESRSCVIKNPDGSVVFEMKDCEIPKSWSQMASDIMISKYFRKAGVPQGDGSFGPEKSAKQVVKRLTGCWRYWGEEYGYFSSKEDAQAFEQELQHMLIRQMAAPNSPQWFNTGLNWAYDINGPAQGHYYVDPTTGEMKKSEDAYTHPQPHACFIQSVSDDLVNEGGIMDLWVKEARLFKYGSGTGTNFSGIRGSGEPLSGGGYSSGLMSFLKIGDRAAGAIKSGGTTRRAAKMVCLDLDHPDIEEFINWKVNEEKKVAALVAAGYDSDFNGEAYATVSGQNSNNSVRVPNSFFKTLEKGGEWDLKWRVDGSVCKKIKAEELWSQIAHAAWGCADPGLQYDTTINEWHTCPNSGRINASNPCSEYMFLDNTACNLASLNLIKYFDFETGKFDLESVRHAVRLWTIVLEISVLMAQFPSKEIAQGSYDFRTLGLGYANLGTCLMIAGIPYDSPEANAICGAISAILTGQSYDTSAEMASKFGVFARYEENRSEMLRVIKNHKRAAYNVPGSEYDSLEVTPMGISEQYCPNYLLEVARDCWDKALENGEKHGYRNAQVTVIAPTGTIGLLMDCDTTGIEPDFALVKFKKLAGGGFFKIANKSIEPALRNLKYDGSQIEDIMTYILGTLNLNATPHINRATLKAKGFTDEDVRKIEDALPGVFEISHAFNAWTLGEDTMARLGIKDYEKPDFNLLKELGFNDSEIKEANRAICGNMTIEGAPHVKDEHLPVFDCANKCGEIGERFIHYMGHVRMMAAAQPFICGSISKTINMPNEATESDIKDAYKQGWELALKCLALYRDGSKLSQVLNNKSSDEEEDKEEGGLEVAVNATVDGQVDMFGGQLFRGQRRDLPQKRKGITIESNVGRQKLHIRTGEYDDGTIGEVFIDTFKEGASYRSLLNCLAVAVSIGLQYGVPLDKYVEKFTFTRFEPSGMTDHPNVKTATSILDFIFRVLGMEYLGRTDFVHVKPEAVKKVKEAITKEHGNSPNGVVKNMFDAVKDKESSADAVITYHNTEEDALSDHLKSMMGDAPPCDVCGHTTVRNGTCYKCLNCGNSLGCS